MQPFLQREYIIRASARQGILPRTKVIKEKDIHKGKQPFINK